MYIVVIIIKNPFSFLFSSLLFSHSSHHSFISSVSQCIIALDRAALASRKLERNGNCVHEIKVVEEEKSDPILRNEDKKYDEKEH